MSDSARFRGQNAELIVFLEKRNAELEELVHRYERALEEIVFEDQRDGSAGTIAAKALEDADLPR
jgi:hypothetical protein